MKRLILLASILIFASSCQNQKDTADLMEHTQLAPTPSLEGTWELIGYYNYQDNKVIDSFNTNDGYRQIKMYTPSRVMWSKEVPKDSTEWFGYGKYKATDSTLVEVLEYGSASMRNIIDTKKEFVYELHIAQDSFSQIELDEEGNRLYSENYKRVE